MNTLISFFERLRSNHEDLRKKMYVIIFEADTPWGKRFDVALMWAILLSLLITVFGTKLTEPWMRATAHALDFIFAVFFGLEYMARIYCAHSPRKYVFSFFGIIDLISVLPVYVSIFLPSAQYLIVLRTFRLLRVFRVFRLFAFLEQGNILLMSIKASFEKILVFFLFVLVLVICMGAVMFIIEGDIEGTPFTDMPTSIYWAVVTLTTVGYGDIAPVTELGRFFSGIVMLIGYTIIAVPTGIVSAQIISDQHRQREIGKDNPSEK